MGKVFREKIDGFEGRVLPQTLTLKEAKAYGEFEIIELKPKAKAKKSDKVKADDKEE